MIWDDVKDLTNLYETLQASFSEVLNIYLTDSHNWIQIMSKEATKEIALLEMLSYHGISSEEVVVFGDDLPDLGIFCTFGCSVAVENAKPELKNAARYTTLSNNENGVCYALREILELI